MKKIFRDMIKRSPKLLLAAVASTNACTMCWIFYKIRFEGVYTFGEQSDLVLNTEIVLCFVGTIFALIAFIVYFVKFVR